MSEHPVTVAGDPALRVRFEDAVPVLELPDALDFEALRALIRASLPAHLPEIQGRMCRFDLGDRPLVLFDLRRLIHLLRDEFGVEIVGLHVRRDAIQRYAERELKLKLYPHEQSLAPHQEPLPGQPGVALDEGDADDVGLSLPSDLTAADLDEDDLDEPNVDAAALDELSYEAPRRTAPEAGSRTLTVHRTLRSGASVRFDGDVIVFGDVNPGAHVIATGNVVVLGALKGMAHAGAEGDESASILAFVFRPTQVRIGRKIAMPPQDRSSTPERAVIRDGSIVIEPYTGRFR